MTSATEQVLSTTAAESPLSTRLEDALAKHQQGRTAEAADAYLKILDADPDNHHALHYLGILHLEEKRFVEAINTFERIRDEDPSDVSALWHLANAYKRAERTADLKLTFKELALQPADTPEMCTLFAERFFEYSETDYALSFVQKALQLSPVSNALKRRLGFTCRAARESLLNCGRSIEATAVLRQEMEINPNDIRLYRLLCQTLGETGLMDEALRYLKALAAEADTGATKPPDALGHPGQFGDGNEPDIWSTLPDHEDVNLLFFAIQLPSYRLAEAICRRLLTMFPGTPALSYIAAIILRESSRASLQKSTAMLQSLEKSYRDEARYCFDMGMLHRDQGNTDSALIWFTRARMQAAEPEPRIFHELGKSHLALGNFADAAKWLKQTITLKPDMYDAYLGIHDALLAEGKIDEAVAVFDNALSTNALSKLTGVHVHPALMSGTADFIATQETARQRGIPSILLNSLGNSGSTYIMLRLTAGLRLPGHSILLGQYDTRDVPIPSAVTNLAKGGSICRQHFEATDKILSEFERCKIHKMVLQVRDPRQLALSNLHYIEMLYADGTYIPRRSRKNFPDDYFERSREKKLDHLIETVISRDMRMIQSWIDAQQTWPKLSIHYCTYENMVTDQDAFLSDILDFYDIAHTDFDWAERVDKSDAHFRKGKLDEWRHVFSDEQTRRAWQLMPEDLSRRFGWKE